MLITPTLKKRSVILQFKINNEKIEVYTGITINPNNWSVKKKEIKGEGKVISLQNQKIKSFKTKIETYIYSLEDKSLFDKESLKLILNERYNKPGDLDLIGYFNVFINKKNSSLKPVTITAYKNTKLHLIGFAKSKNKSRLPFNTINNKFFEDFTNYLKVKKSLSPSTRGKQIKNIKSILNDARKNGEDINLIYKDIKKEHEESIRVYLNEDEVRSLRNLKNLKKKDREIIDSFLFLCYTGMRYSDYLSLEKSNFTNQEKKGKVIYYLNYFQLKTGKEVKVPLLYPESVKLIKKYNYKLPKFSNAHFNKELKRILEEKCIIEDEIQVKKEKIKGSVVKREYVSSHTGRRSFCTNLFLKGIPIQLIMSASGHEEASSFYKYIKASQIEIAEELEKFIEEF